MKRTLITDCTKKIGKKVLIKGWVNSVRSHGKLNFIDIRDRTGILQIIGDDKLKPLKNEYVVSVTGTIQKRQSQNSNPNLSTGQIELTVEKFEILAKASDLPFDTHQKDLNVSLPVMLDYRAASLRHSKTQNIFKIQATITQVFRQYFIDRGFTEFHAPTLVATATEGGSQVFPVKYFDRQIFLAQSPQFYKQIMVSAFERVFTVSHAYRAEPSVTTRHLTEYVGLDVEMSFIDSWEEIYQTTDDLIKNIFKTLKEKHSDILKEYGVTVPQTVKNTPVVKLSQAQEIIFQRTQRDIRGEPDMDPEGEREICRWSQEKHGSEMVFITHFPTKKRPWYTYPDPQNPDETLSFDLIGRGVEWATGGQRINDYQTLCNSIKKMGANPDDFYIPYLQAFEYGMPPEGGFCLGLERMTQNILGLKNVRQATLYPRDMERVDVRLSTLDKKNDVKKKTTT